MNTESTWIQELETPSEAFFTAFAERVAAPDGQRDLLREALKTLIPRIDWEAYQPHVPHGLLGLRAVLRLQPLLGEHSFLRALAIQLHMAATEGRRAAPAAAQVLAAKGSGSWRNLEGFIQSRRPGLAYAEAQGFELPGPEDFQRLGRLTELDMANVGHKAVVCDHFADLHERLERPKATGRRLFGLAAWLAGTPEDTFWARRAAKRLVGSEASVPWTDASLGADALEGQVRDLCDLGLVALLDRFAERLKAGQGAGDTLAALVLAAAEKQLDARRDLEGKTAWTFAYLATLARTRPADPRVWCQAAALVNLFPTDEPEDRVQPGLVPAVAPEALLEAILDSEAALAMGQAQSLMRGGKAEAVLATLAEAATRNDPTFNHAHQLIAVAAAADLAPHLPTMASEAMLVALAKSLANSQGSGDLGRLADRALDARGAS
ncbi:MAG: hypothetical protein HXX12_03290 [Geothrix sp.]|uniref:hypothetical protein n=1 Tax=Geothrix sp. TaxID=1962974 RepID=UPI00181D7A0F|nr:hypothetical protein [Geothrix sp.]NWJ39983.1 hypothetical protein [Geothrix sp.]WIL22006.1 MAG: hypothetical protein QOZ81_001292 [Geothrix sp.]